MRNAYHVVARQGKQAQSLKRISHIAYDILKRLLRPVFTSSDEDDVHELHKLVRLESLPTTSKQSLGDGHHSMLNGFE